VEYLKGFMEFDKLYSFLEGFADSWRELEAVIHFRLTSVGRTVPEMTHPFPICGIYERERDGIIYGVARGVLFHNGTMSRFGSRLSGKSDTCEFAELLDSLKKKRLSWEDLVKLIDKFGSGRFVLMTGRKTWLIGEFSKKYRCKFSNLYWDVRRRDIDFTYYSYFYKAWQGGDYGD